MTQVHYAVFTVFLLLALGSFREWTRRRQRRTLKMRAAIFATLSADIPERQN